MSVPRLVRGSAYLVLPLSLVALAAEELSALNPRLLVFAVLGLGRLAAHLESERSWAKATRIAGFLPLAIGAAAFLGELGPAAALRLLGEAGAALALLLLVESVLGDARGFILPLGFLAGLGLLLAGGSWLPLPALLGGETLGAMLAGFRLARRAR